MAAMPLANAHGLPKRQDTGLIAFDTSKLECRKPNSNNALPHTMPTVVLRHATCQRWSQHQCALDL